MKTAILTFTKKDNDLISSLFNVSDNFNYCCDDEFKMITFNCMINRIVSVEHDSKNRAIKIELGCKSGNLIKTLHYDSDKERDAILRAASEMISRGGKYMLKPGQKYPCYANPQNPFERLWNKLGDLGGGLNF
jgi:hypothetical protein